MLYSEPTQIVCCECGTRQEVPAWYIEEYGTWADVVYAHNRAWRFNPHNYDTTCTVCQGMDDEEVWEKVYGTLD